MSSFFVKIVNNLGGPKNGKKFTEATYNKFQILEHFLPFAFIIDSHFRRIKITRLIRTRNLYPFFMCFREYLNTNMLI